MLALTPAETEALLLSLRVCSVATACSVLPAIGVGWVLARFEFPGKQLLNGLVHLSLVLPPPVTGYLLLLAFGRNGPVGRILYEAFGITVAFRWTGAVIAAAVMGFPLFVQAVRVSFEAIDFRLEQAAATLGASPLRRFLTISIPLALPGISAGLILDFAKALGEFGATITFVSNIPGQTRTIPLAIFNYTQVPGGEPAALRLALLSIALGFTAIMLSELLTRRLQRGMHGHVS